MQSLVLVLLLVAWCQADENIFLTRVARDIDLKSHLVKEKATITLQNNGAKTLDRFTYSVASDKLAYIEASEDHSGSTVDLAVKASRSNPRPEITNYDISIIPLLAGDSATIVVETTYARAIVPFPKVITQSEKQLVQFTGSAHFLSPYTTKTQSTTVILPNANVESFTRISPVNTNDNEITYGPYSDVGAFSLTKIVVHFENNGPFIRVLDLQRIIEVSHWGNIAVEEHVHIKHCGAVLKGSFSRYDFQRNPNSGVASVKSYKTLLPAAARDAYYRDEIGNISTSHLREDEDFVELELRPRFPLFGGWQTRYYIGYNVPSYEYLHRDGSNFLLQLRFIDHVFDDQLIENVTVKVILPEGSSDVEMDVPYDVEKKEIELHYTYLDTVGRPVVTATASNLVEQHIQDFMVFYKFRSVMLLQEPLLMVAALYLFFLAVIILVRIDFSITHDKAVVAKQQASVFMDAILSSHDRRSALVERFREAIAAYKHSKNVKAFKATKKQLEEKYQAFTDDITAQSKKLQAIDAEAGAKVNELQKRAKELRAVVVEACQLAEGVVSERLGKQAYVEQEKGNQSRLTRLQQEIDSTVQTLG